MIAVDAVFGSLALRWLAGWYLAGRLLPLRSAVARAERTVADAAAAVSVVIPARNEAQSLPALLRSLRAQTFAPIQIIVVDDHSTDATAHIAAAGGATVVHSAEVPQGWLGKPWACAQGAALARGNVLVFLDADTIASPDLLRHLVLMVLRVRGLVSLAPYHEVRRAYELASALFNLVAVIGVGASSLRSNAPVTGAFGPCLAIRAADYAAIGGHGAVRGALLDDVALARGCVAHALPVHNVAGGADVRYRMYPNGVAQLVEGWSKNFAAGAGTTPLPRLVGIVAWLSGLFEAGLVTSVSVAGLLAGGDGPPWQHALFYGLSSLQLWLLLRRIGNQGVVAIVHPLASVAFVSICAYSMALHLRGTVTWKGRTISVAAKKPAR